MHPAAKIVITLTAVAPPLILQGLGVFDVMPEQLVRGLLAALCIFYGLRLAKAYEWRKTHGG